MRRRATEIKVCGCELVIIPGNDDNSFLLPALEAGDQEGLWHFIPDRVRTVGGIEFCGCPWIRDYPFGYKYWVAPESVDNLAISSFQLGPPLLISSENGIEEIDDFEAYLAAKVSIAESLERLCEGLRDRARSIWLIHEPPAWMSLDLCASGDRVGSPAVYRFLEQAQPLLSLHGHIHEAPRYNGGIWAGRIGQTIVIQPGQLNDTLYYAQFELYRGKIRNLRHSVYRSLPALL